MRFPVSILLLSVLMTACASEDTSSPDAPGYTPPTGTVKPSPAPTDSGDDGGDDEEPGWETGTGGTPSDGESPTPDKVCPDDMRVVKGDPGLGQSDFCMDKTPNAGYPARANLPWADGLCSGTTGYAVNVGAGKHLCYVSEMKSACIAGIDTYYMWTKWTPAAVVSPWKPKVDDLWGDYIVGTAGSQCSQLGNTDHAGDTDLNSTLRFYCCK